MSKREISVFGISIVDCTVDSRYLEMEGAHTNFFAQFQSAMFSEFRLQLSPLAKSVGRGRRDAQLNFHWFYLSDPCAFGCLH